MSRMSGKVVFLTGGGGAFLQWEGLWEVLPGSSVDTGLDA